MAATGSGERRRCKLPAVAVVYFVICLCLFAGADTLAPPGYRPVMSSLMRCVRPAGRYRLPVSSAFTKARQRLGQAPLRWLFEQTRGPIACPATPGAFALGVRLVSWDGALFEVADTPAHHLQFPAGTGVGDPQVRVLTLTECATHAVIDAVFGGAGLHSEQALGATLSRTLTPGMLLLADRLFPGYELRAQAQAQASGAQLLWRVKCKNVYHPVADLPDGSQLAVMATPRGPAVRQSPVRAPSHQRIPTGSPDPGHRLHHHRARQAGRPAQPELPADHDPARPSGLPGGPAGCALPAALGVRDLQQ